MKLAIMQPYFLPYIGYMQLINAVDCFVVYDNIKYTKKGWFHRNQILVNGNAKMFSVPIKKDSDCLDVSSRKLASNFDIETQKILRLIEASYRKAPNYKEIMPLLEKCFKCNSDNLFSFIHASLILLLQFFEIDTKIIVSSSVDVDHTLKSQDKIIAICKSLGSETYINAIGGQCLYSKAVFEKIGIELLFLKTKPITYDQFGIKFIPSLSIIDVMMFNSKEQINVMLEEYETV